jgi:hypothetical protein
MGGVVHIPWYATLFRGDRFAEALREIAPVALRYGATAFEVHRSHDDPYRFLHTCDFATEFDWERYWDGPEMIEFRGRYASWYQVPILPVFFTRYIQGTAAAQTNGVGERSRASQSAVRE